MLPSATIFPSLAVLFKLHEEADRPLHFRDQVVEHRPHGLEDRLGFFGLERVRFRCSALVKVTFISLVIALVKWLPPSGMLRCHTR